MPVESYQWPALERFRNRVVELRRLETWWASDSSEPMTLWGRRRVGKSWLFRRFAHGKPALILVADRVSMGLQLERVARELEPALGVVPQLNDIADLFTTLYRLARDTKTLVVIDELPYLLGTSGTEQNANLSAIQAVMERERDASQIRLILAGSTITTMEGLLSERNPLHGRLQPLPITPMGFAHARELMGHDRAVQGPLEELTHFAIAGGMPRYLTALAGEDLLARVTATIVDPGGALFNEPRGILASELREPAMYFSILASLAVKPASAADISAALRLESRDLSAYLQTLESLHLVTRHEAVGAAPGSRGTTRWYCDDDFVRFWFRFVQPFQGELEAGIDPTIYLQRRVVPDLPQHVSLTFERVFNDWMRGRYGSSAPRVGAWWGNSLNSLRRARERFSEEIDSVVLDGRNIVAVGEAKWTQKPMGADVLTDLDNYKLPALVQAGFTVSGVDIVLASKSGFTDGLTELARRRSDVRLLMAEELLAEL